MQIKTTLRCYRIPVRMGKINNTSNSSWVSLWSKENILPLLVEVQTGTTTMEVSVEIPQEDGTGSTLISSYSQRMLLPNTETLTPSCCQN